MIRANELYDLFKLNGISFFTGVPDSQLKAFCDYIAEKEGIGKNHIVAPNEGNAVALAGGYHISTGKTGLVYMQNSGLGNAVNPITSLTDPKVYGIPVVYLIGWRGRPGIHDEPQHVMQGKITPQLLDVLEIKYHIIEKETTIDEIRRVFENEFKPCLKDGRSVAFVVAKDALETCSDYHFDGNKYVLEREDAIKSLVERTLPSDIIVSTTGKISRELYECREKFSQGHERDFLTVGSMGHCSMIALSIAQNSPDKRVFCIDGDGAMLMHLGAMALIGSSPPRNYIHVMLNNCVHESVGGIPTIAGKIDFAGIAKACGYQRVLQLNDKNEFPRVFEEINSKNVLTFLQINVKIGSRSDLGRPKTTPQQNKSALMEALNGDLL